MPVSFFFGGGGPFQDLRSFRAVGAVAPGLRVLHGLREPKLGHVLATGAPMRRRAHLKP